MALRDDTFIKAIDAASQAIVTTDEAERAWVVAQGVREGLKDSAGEVYSLMAIGSSATGSDLVIGDAGASYAAQTLTAKTVTISAANAADTAAGTGARTVLLSGLDANYNPLSEVIALNGQTGVNSVGSYLFVNKLEVLTVGSGATNAGIIYAGTGTITTGVPATQWIQVLAGMGVSRSGVMVVPAGYTAISKRLLASNGTATNACTLKVWSQSPTGPLLRVMQASIPGLDVKQFENTLVFPEKTFIKLTGNNVTATSAMTVAFDYFLNKN